MLRLPAQIARTTVRVYDPIEDPESGNGLVRQITQDEDVDPSVLDEITHQMNRVADDSENDELFDSITGHEWKSGVLLFKVTWKTDESSLLPFATVKRDYPCETAAYILKDKVGSGVDARYTGGRYS
jgi:hypothetical protein